MPCPAPVCRSTRRLSTALVTVLLSLAPAQAQDASAGDDKPIIPANGIPEKSIATSLPAPFKDAWGTRKAWADKGVAYSLNYIGEVFGVISGGVKRGSRYGGRFELIVDADLEKIAGWKGASFHLNAFNIHGTGTSRYNVGNLMPVSYIEALPTTRLSEAWFEQKLANDKLSIRAGQLVADGEFTNTSFGAIFLNGSTGWPVIHGANLPAGGPAYPFATPGIRVKYEASPQFAILGAIFNGSPAGRGTGDPQRTNRYGLDFRLKDSPFAITEAQYKYNQEKGSGLAGSIKIGAWHHFGAFNDRRFGSDGLLLGNPLSNGDPLHHRGNSGIYGVLDQQLYRPSSGEPDKGIGAFLRVFSVPSDRNLINLYADTGLVFSGMMEQRPDDTFGIAFGYAHKSKKARAFDIDFNALNGTNRPIGSSEAFVELTYNWKVVDGWSIQPNLQYIMRPNAHSLDPNDPTGTRAIRNATVLGVRTTLKY